MPNELCGDGDSQHSLKVASFNAESAKAESRTAGAGESTRGPDLICKAARRKKFSKNKLIHVWSLL